MKELLKQYFEAFSETFPLGEFTGTKEELIAVIRQCIESGTPYNSNYMGDDE